MLAAAIVPLIALIAGVPFHTVTKGDGGASTIGKRSNLTIKTKTRWTDMWSDLGEQGRPRRVDFSRYMLVAVTEARQVSGGRDIKVESVSRTAGGGYLVQAVETSPGTGCFTPSVITRPYHVVRVPRVSGRVSFAVRRKVVVEC
jgi:PrcB C-terminal